MPVFSTVLDPKPCEPDISYRAPDLLCAHRGAGSGSEGSHSGVGVVEEEDFRAWVARLPHAGVWQECSSGSCSLGVP